MLVAGFGITRMMDACLGERRANATVTFGGCAVLHQGGCSRLLLRYDYGMLTYHPAKPVFSVVLAGLVLAPLPAFADALQQQIVAGAREVTAEDFAFTQTSINERTGKGAKEYILAFDPKRPKEARWTLVRVEGRAPTAKEQAGLAKRAGKGRVPSYADIAKWFGGPATRVSGGKASATYRFASLPAGTIKLGSHDASADTAAEAVVNTSGALPFVERVRFTSNRPFRMMMVAKVEQMDMSVTYGLMANNRPAVVGNTVSMSGSLMGKAGAFKSRTGFSNIWPVR